MHRDLLDMILSCSGLGMYTFFVVVVKRSFDCFDGSVAVVSVS